MSRYLTIDEEGFIALDGARVENPEIGSELLKNLERMDKDRFVTHWDNQEVLVEAFDEPLVVKHVEKRNGKWFFTTPYDFTREFSLATLCVDEWDRFHGQTENKIAFVFSRQAQMEFFDAVDEFDDESVTIDGNAISIPPFFIQEPQIEDTPFWSDLYNADNKPGWEIGEPARPLRDVLPQIKLAKSRVLVLGCGTGRDAAFLAEQGHVVTGVDFAPEAIEKAKKDFGHIPNLEFFQQDIFNLNIKGSFDLIFDHACFVAIPPEKRNDLINIWKKHLVPGGHLLAIFFVMSKRGGPPFGASEWEYRERLKKSFRFLYWTRWRNSIPRRIGRELVIYAQKL